MAKDNSSQASHIHVPIPQKYMLTVKEASEYSNLCIRQVRFLAERHTDDFAIFHGNKYLIIRHLFEEYLDGCLGKEGNILD